MTIRHNVSSTFYKLPFYDLQVLCQVQPLLNFNDMTLVYDKREKKHVQEQARHCWAVTPSSLSHYTGGDILFMLHLIKYA